MNPNAQLWNVVINEQNESTGSRSLGEHLKTGHMITSKPANGEWPGLVAFTLSSASCLPDSDWTIGQSVFFSLDKLYPALEAVETVGNSARFAEFSKRSFHSLWSKKALSQG